MNKDNKKKFRCTRNEPYEAPGCAGNDYFTARQGHYVFTETPLGAAMQMLASWPDEILHGFIIQDLETNRVFSWNARNGLVLYRLNEEAMRDRYGELEDKPSVNMECHEEPPPATLDLPTIVAQGKRLYDADPATREVVDDFRKLRIRLTREAEAQAKKEDQERREAERQAASASEGGPTERVEGTVDVDVMLRKKVAVDVPVELLEEYRKNVQAGPCDDAMNRMSELFEQAAIGNGLEVLGELDGWSVEGYENLIAEW